MTRYQKHKIFSLFLIFALVLTMLPTMAIAEDTNEDEDIFSVTVPAVLHLTVSKDGTVYAADTAQIVNDSTSAVSVTNVSLFAENGWEIVPYSTNMANEKVNAKRIGFCINGAESGTTFVERQIAKDGTLDLDYDAVVSATSEPIDEQVLTVVFVLGWA